MIRIFSYKFLTISLLVVVCLAFLLPSFSAEAVSLEIGFNNIRTANGIVGYMRLVYNFASGIVAALAVVMIIIGGIQYSTAAGNPKGIAQAKETIISAIVGLVIVALAYLILGTFGTQFVVLDEPTLPTVTIGDPQSTPSSQGNRYFCSDGGKCWPTETGAGDPQCTQANQDCTPSASGPDCPNISESECWQSQPDCHWCDTATGGYCAYSSDPCI